MKRAIVSNGFVEPGKWLCSVKSGGKQCRVFLLLYSGSYNSCIPPSTIFFNFFDPPRTPKTGAGFDPKTAIEIS
jgi:hypothetical protein